MPKHKIAPEATFQVGIACLLTAEASGAGLAILCEPALRGTYAQTYSLLWCFGET